MQISLHKTTKAYIMWPKVSPLLSTMITSRQALTTQLPLQGTHMPLVGPMWQSTFSKTYFYLASLTMTVEEEVSCLSCHYHGLRDMAHQRRLLVKNKKNYLNHKLYFFHVMVCQVGILWDQNMNSLLIRCISVILQATKSPQSHVKSHVQILLRWPVILLWYVLPVVQSCKSTIRVIILDESCPLLTHVQIQFDLLAWWDSIIFS